jgi:hypothetical protein
MGVVVDRINSMSIEFSFLHMASRWQVAGVMKWNSVHTIELLKELTFETRFDYFLSVKMKHKSLSGFLMIPMSELRVDILKHPNS